MPRQEDWVKIAVCMVASVNYEDISNGGTSSETMQSTDALGSTPQRCMASLILIVFEENSLLLLVGNQQLALEEKKGGYKHRWCAVHTLPRDGPRW
jgi:hypothetical protein